MHKVFVLTGFALLICSVSLGQTDVAMNTTASHHFNNVFTALPEDSLSRTTRYYSGIAQTCLSTHLFNDCGTAGYITLGFTPFTGANTSSADPLTIQQSNLSVGINNNNPQAKLHIKGIGATNTTTSFLVNNNANTEVFRILDNGNIGIGTSNPATTLSVNGIVSAQRVRVSPTGWSDYVFDKDYELPTLREVERYVSRNKHLPGLAPAEEVMKNGIDLGDNQSILLKKIEELTLYLIQQNKELQQLRTERKKIEEQRTRLERQQQEIDTLKELVQKLISREK